MSSDNEGNMYSPDNQLPATDSNDSVAIAEDSHALDSDSLRSFTSVEPVNPADFVLPNDMIFDAEGDPDWDTYYANVIGDVAPSEMPRNLARRHPDLAAVVGAMGLGIQRVFEPQKVKQEIVVQRDDSGDPDNPDKPLHLDFDPDDPRQTRATVRPHKRASAQPQGLQRDDD
jgi:hypothetical protein